MLLLVSLIVCLAYSYAFCSFCCRVDNKAMEDKEVVGERDKKADVKKVKKEKEADDKFLY